MTGRDIAGHLLGILGVLMTSSGCAGLQHDDSLRLSEELGRARAQLAWERAQADEANARAARLEARVVRLELGARDAEGARNAESLRILERLDRVLAVTEGLAEERLSASASTTTPGPSVRAPSSATTPKEDADLDGVPRECSRSLAGVQQCLSAEEQRALRLLLRTERKLDTTNPWPSALY